VPDLSDAEENDIICETVEHRFSFIFFALADYSNIQAGWVGEYISCNEGIG